MIMILRLILNTVKMFLSLCINSQDHYFYYIYIYVYYKLITLKNYKYIFTFYVLFF